MNILKNAHARARNGYNFKRAARMRRLGLSYEKYSTRLARAMRFFHAMAKGLKLQGKKVVVISTGCVAFIKSAIMDSVTLQDANGNAFWKCGTRNGSFRMNDLKLA